MSANIQDILKEKFANVDVEQVSAQINEEIKKSTENMENKLQTGMIMDGVAQTEEQKQAKENLNEAVGLNQEQIMQAMARYKAAHTPKIKEHKIGRNDPCPCGSGKKYKNCCLSTGKYEKYVTSK